MLRDVQVEGSVTVCVENIEEGGRIGTSDVAACLLRQTKAAGADKDYGYLVAVTRVVSIGKGIPCTKPLGVTFPVTFLARAFLPRRGDVMIGTVHRVAGTGVLLECGPMKVVYLSRRRMGNYSLVDGEEPFFLGGDQSRIEKDSVIRFKVLDARWQPPFWCPRHFSVLATIRDPSLGPIQSAGDAMDLESICPDE